MEDFQRRVLHETEELDEKIARLSVFLSSEKSRQIDGHERTLLGSQLQAMRTYSAFLHARIQYWESRAS